MDIIIVHDDPSVVDRIKNADFKSSHFIKFIDEGSLKGKKEAFKLKGAWGARMTPFVAIFEGEEIIKAFYTEADKDVIGTLINYLKNESTNN